MAQASSISSSLIINGGASRMALSQNKNQSLITPFLIQQSIIFLLFSKESNCNASNKPMPLISVIFG